MTKVTCVSLVWPYRPTLRVNVESDLWMKMKTKEWVTAARKTVPVLVKLGILFRTALCNLDQGLSLCNNGK